MERENYPTIFHFPSFDRFIILDLETTGLSPETSSPFQFTAIKVENWTITDFFNEYAKVPLEDIPYSLAKKLHLEEITDEIKSAPPLEDVLKRFLSFISDLPLIAHSVSFDIGFLKKYKPDLFNPFLDSIELLALAYPLSTSFSLEALIDEHKVREEVEKLKSQLNIRGDIFPHNALFDCLALFCLLKKAVEKLKSSTGASFLHYISPLLAQSIALPPPPVNYIPLLPSPLEEVEDLREIMREKEMFNFRIKDALYFYQRWQRETKAEKRPSQKQMITRVAYLFKKKKFGMIEAPTGTGKTIAYLIPAIFFSKRGGGKVYIATHTKHLQNQAYDDLDRKLFPHLKNSFSTPLRYVIIKGKSNYLCLNSLFQRMEDAFHNFPDETGDDEKFLLIYLARFVEDIKNKVDDLDAIPFLLNIKFPFLGSLKESIKSEWDTCRGRKCQYYYHCFSQKAQMLERDADIVITNHWKLLSKNWEKAHDFCLVIDEAHTLEDAASDVYGNEITKENLANLLSLLLDKEGRRGLLLKLRKILKESKELNATFAIVRDLWELSDEMGKAFHNYLKAERVPLHPVYGASLALRNFSKRSKKEWRAIQKTLNKLNNSIRNLEENKVELQRSIMGLAIYQHLALELDFVVNNLSKRIKDLQKLLLEEYDRGRYVRWIEIHIEREAGETISEEVLENPPAHRLNWMVKEAPLRVDEQLRENLFKHFRSIVFTSATLTVAGKGFGFFIDRLGLEGYVSEKELHQLKPVFNYNENALLFLPTYLLSDASQKNIEEFKKEVLQELADFISFVEGRTLVLFSARDRLEWVGERLEKTLSERKLPLYWQRPGFSRRQMLQEFKEIEESSLLGLRSFWEGVDVPGKSLSYLILEKLPFPHIGDPLVQARREDVRIRGGDDYNDYLLPMTIIPFKQGFGRLIRSHKDRGVVIYLDKRLRSDVATRETALQSLPGFKRMEEKELSKSSLYRAIAEHMKEVFPDFPWEKKLIKIREREKAISPAFAYPELEELREGGTFLIETLNLSPLLSYLKKLKKSLIISPTNPVYSLEERSEDEIIYISSEPLSETKSILEKWDKGEVAVLAIHPYWLEEGEIRKHLKEIDALLIPNALNFEYSSTFFSPLMKKNLPEAKTKILLLPPLNDDLSAFQGRRLRLDDSESVKVSFGRISSKDIFPILNRAREEGEDVLIYKPQNGEALVRELRERGFLAGWGESEIPLLQKDLLNVLVLPPGMRSDKRGIKYVIHYPPVGDKLSFMIEALQAGGKDEGGFAFSCLLKNFPEEKLAREMFPIPKDLKEIVERLRIKKQMSLSFNNLSPKTLRVLYLLGEDGQIEWRLVEERIELILRDGVKDKMLRKILEKAGATDKMTKLFDLNEISEDNDVPIEEISSALHMSALQGEVDYRVKNWQIAVRSLNLNNSLPQLPATREEILREWSKLFEFVSSIPFISEENL